METALQPRLAVDHRIRAEVDLRERELRRFAGLVRQREHVSTIGGKRQLGKRAGKAGTRLDEREQGPRGHVQARQCPAQHADGLAHEPVVAWAHSSASHASTAAASPSVFSSQVPISSSLLRIDRIASSSSRAIASGHQLAPAASTPVKLARLRGLGRQHGKRRSTLGAVDGDAHVLVLQRIGADAALEGVSFTPWPAGAGRYAQRAVPRAACTTAANCEGFASASTSRQSTARWPRTPSAVVQKMSA